MAEGLPMLRIAPRLMIALLCGSLLAGCATTGAQIARLTGAKTAETVADKDTSAARKPATDLESGVRQAQLQRTAGQYDDAIRTLSQLMIVASDDPRVVAEYGKTLAQKGRAQDAVEFLSRAIELSANDWTLYSAMGASYDQLGNHDRARAAYEHALAIRPGEPSVLNNYALSRMMDGDKDGARILIGRAQSNGGAADAKIAANIAMLDKLAPAPEAPKAVAQNTKSVGAPLAQNSLQVSRPVIQMPALPPQRPMAQNAPRPIMPANLPPMSLPPMPQQQQIQQQRVAAAPSNRVVMQAVPFDPLAGPARQAPVVARPPALPPLPKLAAAAKPDAGKQTAPAAKPAAPAAKPAAAKTAAAKPAPTPIKATAKDQVPALRMTATAY